MNVLIRAHGRRVTLALLLILVVAGCDHPPPLPFSCSNFTESYWAEFGFGVDSPAEVASTVSRLWGVNRDKVSVEENMSGTDSRVFWMDRKIYGTLAGYGSWFREGVLIKVEALWRYPNPTLSQAIECLGAPEYYVAFDAPGPEVPILTLALVYPEKGIAVHYEGLYPPDWSPEKSPLHPNTRIRSMSVVSPGTTEEVTHVVYSMGVSAHRLNVRFACLLKPWPGSVEAMKIASIDEYFQCLP